MVVGWGNKCFHCGSDSHTRKDCKSFDKMMRDANVGKPKDQWKPPNGYKSALGKAREAQKAKNNSDKKKINAVGWTMTQTVTAICRRSDFLSTLCVPCRKFFVR